MKDYVKSNRAVYDKLAPEYQTNFRKYRKKLVILETVRTVFVRKIKKSFKGEIKIIDLGCGAGLILSLVSGYNFDLYGQDISPKMLRYAKKNIPEAKFMQGDFLTMKINQKFEGVMLGAFIHLFKEVDAKKVLNKVVRITKKNGYCFIDTSAGTEQKEGYFEKHDYKIKDKRFRRFYTEKDFRALLNSNKRLKLLHFTKINDQLKKRLWFVAVLKRV